MRLLITGSSGFIGRNLIVRAGEMPGVTVTGLGRDATPEAWAAAMIEAEAVIHLAGANRPPDPADFTRTNVDLTRDLCRRLQETGRAVPIVFASSTHAARDTEYGRSKAGAERVLSSYATSSGAPAAIFRFPNVFGKWCRPEYNSAVATFCHHIARGLPIRVDDPAAPLTLAYIDDVVDALLREALAPGRTGLLEMSPVYDTTVGEVVSMIRGFAEGRGTLTIANTGSGLARALYATYISYLPPEVFAYRVPKHDDPRGTFVEMLKTPSAGQVSYFTAPPGVTRGGHYHHSKTEKFLVIAGTARFRFRDLRTGRRHELTVTGADPQVVDTAPGWVHDITNVGDSLLVVMLWANEVFDRSRPDTVNAPI